MKFDWQIQQQSRILHIPNAHTKHLFFRRRIHLFVVNSFLLFLLLFLLYLALYLSLFITLGESNYGVFNNNIYFYRVSTILHYMSGRIRRHWCFWILYYLFLFSLSLLAMCILQQMCYILNNDRLPFVTLSYEIVHSYNHYIRHGVFFSVGSVCSVELLHLIVCLIISYTFHFFSFSLRFPFVFFILAVF